MDINIFLLCYNEAALIPHTIAHYKKYLPSCKITIYDNESTDNSINIAKEHGCNVIPFSTKNIHDENLQIQLRNECWKVVKSGWVIMADMDEFVCVTESDLSDEINLGTSILNITGIDMIGESETLDLTDIDLQQIKKYVINDYESKSICFLRDKISEMQYGPGSHSCNPLGIVKYSLKTYINKHMSNLGLPFLTDKMIKRYARNEKMRSKGWNTHYTNNIEQVKVTYNKLLNNHKLL
jgi:glycosyltransferase involved in cell wall biosynthesis